VKSPGFLFLDEPAVSTESCLGGQSLNLLISILDQALGELRGHTEHGVDRLEALVVEHGEAGQAKQGVPYVGHVVWPICDTASIGILYIQKKKEINVFFFSELYSRWLGPLNLA
jgi:hypothetical protein